MIRKSKKINKLRGSRTCGGGCSKKRRGAGHRGGRGNAGSGKEKKQKYTWFQKYEPDHLGKHGFQRANFLRSDVPSVNISFLDQNIGSFESQGVIEFEDGTPVVDITKIGFQKVLGSGKLTRPMIVKAPFFSERAKLKIEEAGGKAISS
ncbi:MAG: 50S ribosomal protein L15 [Candidatus Methanofastidiosa archaeon]|nr:50S ribosomal protein L15 [Candidatus Methanofastidiosa archaeon]